MKTRPYRLFYFLFVLAVSACATAPQEPPLIPTIESVTDCPAIGKGGASYYADKFNGRRTASGEIFSNQKMTAAHKTLPFGSEVMVVNPANGKSVFVRINDRGPFVRGRIIDLSKAAARELDIMRAGVAPVTVHACPS